MSLAPIDPPVIDRSYRDVRRASGLRLMQCRCRAAAGERPVDEQHAAFSVTVVQRGSFTYRTRAGRAELAPGWLMLGNEGEGYVCSHENSDGSGDDCLFLSLPAPVLEEALAAIGDAGSRLPFKAAALPPSPRVMALLRTLEEEGTEGFALEEAALAIVAAVRRSLDDIDADGPVDRQDERARAAAQLMDAQGTQALALDELARVAGLSEFHLLRVFRRSIGITPHQYLMRVRLLRAIELLRDTALPITRIAYDAGWEDLSNFNRAFRRELGCSPREFRRADAKMLRLAARP
jgi:AraC-like DNA-binding protein